MVDAVVHCRLAPGGNSGPRVTISKISSARAGLSESDEVLVLADCGVWIRGILRGDVGEWDFRVSPIQYGDNTAMVKELQRAGVAVDTSFNATVLTEASPTPDLDELDRRAIALRAHGLVPRPSGREHPKRVPATSRDAFERDPRVKAWVLQEANGVCELCRGQAPFVTADSSPFLEVHHPRRLADGGRDTVDNAAALCPNCHRALHLAADRAVRLDRLYHQVERLRRR
jgi:5-methylcytosine-specific restriction endonuclease McrA